MFQQPFFDQNKEISSLSSSVQVSFRRCLLTLQKPCFRVYSVYGYPVSYKGRGCNVTHSEKHARSFLKTIIDYVETNDFYGF